VAAGDDIWFIKWFYADFAEDEVSHVFDVLLKGGEERFCGYRRHGEWG